MGIELPEAQCKMLVRYMKRIFEREAFQESLSEAEREMRD
jgi:RNA polymerase-associated protein